MNGIRFITTNGGVMNEFTKSGLSRRAFLGLGATAAVADVSARSM